MASRPLQLNTPIEIDPARSTELLAPCGQAQGSGSESSTSTPTDDYFSIKPKLSVTISNDISSTHYQAPIYRIPYSSVDSVNSLSSPPEYLSADYEADYDEDDHDQYNNRAPFTPFTPLTPTLLDDEKDSTGSQASVFFNSPLNLDMKMMKKDPVYIAYNFLLVDDNPINLKILEKVLTRLYPNANITKIQDSTLVKPTILHRSFDLVFLDIEMPNITGVELATFMRSCSKYDTWGIIAVTTRNTPNDVSLYSSAGIDFTFPKPLTRSYDHILDIVNSVISTRQDSLIAL